MSTITINQLLRSNALKRDRGFNSLFAAYANTQRRDCGKCRRKKADMTTCITLLGSLITNRRDLLAAEFGIPGDAELSVYNMGTAFGIRVK